jgi:uncharacterized protein YjbI with pentapeptide repeats
MNAFKSVATAAALVAASIAMPAHAGLTWNGTEFNGIKWNGPLLQGVRLNGLQFNGPGLILQGISLNGPVLQGVTFEGVVMTVADKAGQPVAVTLADGTFLPIAR